MSKGKTTEKVVEIGSLIPDNANANRGTLIGKGLLAKSFSEVGAGRSVLIDKNDRIIAGNKSKEAAEKSGITDVVVVEATGDTLIAVRRTDLDLDTAEGRAMAAYDNTTSVRNLEWDESALQYVSAKFGVDTRDFGLQTKEWEDGYKPNLNPTQQNSATTASDIQRAKDKVEGMIQHHKDGASLRHVECPNCGYKFDIQKYD
jgi:hypothetical protein